MAKTDLARLPKSVQKVARSAISVSARNLRENFQRETVMNLGAEYLAGAAAAYVDHKWRAGVEGEARFGDLPLDGTEPFRPPMNAVISLAATAAGLFVLPKRYAGTALALGAGFGIPAIYAFTRNTLAK